MTYNHVHDTNEQSRHPKYLYRVSLVVQWLRVCFAMQGHQFAPWSGTLSHAMGQQSPGAQWLSPSPRACASQEKPPQTEATSAQLESSPCSLQLGKAHVQQQRPSAANKDLINKILNLCFKKTKKYLYCVIWYCDIRRNISLVFLFLTRSF